MCAYGSENGVRSVVCVASLRTCLHTWILKHCHILYEALTTEMLAPRMCYIAMVVTVHEMMGASH